MLRCPQTEDQNVLEHGFSVNRYFLDLIAVEQQLQWRLPSWFADYREQLLKTLHPSHIIDHYTVYHDCGKPYCLQIDGSGKRHFTNHAAVSRDVYLGLGGEESVADLIGWDMVLHTDTADQIDAYLKIWSKQDAATLLLAALSEIHSNAAMFGGMDSTSFKIKWKQLNKRGKQICKRLFNCDLEQPR